MPTEWYVRRNEKKLGPFSNKDLRKLAAAGKLAPADLVWKEGLGDWVAASRVESLFETVSETVSHHVGATADSAVESHDASISDEKTGADGLNDSELSADEFDDHDLPPLPPITLGRTLDQTAATATHGLDLSSSRELKLDSAERLSWWLRFYASVNFASSLFIATPLFLFGLYAFLWNLSRLAEGVTVVGNMSPAEHFFYSVGLVGALTNVVMALLGFMLMNVFTLACHWGAEVLNLLKLRR